MPALPIGRFAPSPTGRLHLGSLVTAVASYCHIKSLGGQWLVRIEDVDFERCKAEYTASILDDLAKLHLISDLPIVHQSDRTALYEQYLKALPTYVCACTRKELAGTDIYPRHCLPKATPRTTPTITPKPPSEFDKLRLILPNVAMGFCDSLQGQIWQNPQTLLGDVVVKRSNGMTNYILACAIDDGIQGITHIMRGLDILPMTMTQVFIQKSLNLPTPHAFYHLPLIYNDKGQKLSKQTLATPIDTTHPSDLLIHALHLLGQAPPAPLKNAHPSEILAYAVCHWDNTPLKKQTLAVV